MLKKFFKLYFFLLLIFTSLITYSEVREIITIEEYSKQFLDENFVLEDLKEEAEQKENIETAIEENIRLEEEKEILSVIDIQEENKIESNIEENLEEKENIVPDIENIKKEDLETAIKEVENIQTISEELIDEEEISEEKYQKEMAEIENAEKEKKSAKTSVKNGKIDWTLSEEFRAVLIGDLNGNVYYSKNADKMYPLASVTKVMSLMVIFDEIKAGRASLKNKVKIGKNPIKYGGSGIPLKVGQVFTLEDLIKASAIYSANNATYAMAEFIGKGSVNKFVDLMNKKIKSLGLEKDIKYYTPAGLPTRMTKKPMDSGTARAIYKLSIEALKYKKYIDIAGIEKTTIHSGKISIKNRNHLLGKEGIYGIKTGYHKEAKYNITVATKIDNLDVIVVVMGGKSYTTRDKIVLDLLEIFKENYYTANILDKTKIIGTVKVGDTNINVPVLPDKNYKIALKNSQEYKVELKQRENIKLNIFKGEDLGEYTVYIDNKAVLKGRLLAQKAVKK